MLCLDLKKKEITDVWSCVIFFPFPVIVANIPPFSTVSFCFLLPALLFFMTNLNQICLSTFAHYDYYWLCSNSVFPLHNVASFSRFRLCQCYYSKSSFFSPCYILWSSASSDFGPFHTRQFLTVWNVPGTLYLHFFRTPLHDVAIA